MIADPKKLKSLLNVKLTKRKVRINLRISCISHYKIKEYFDLLNIIHSFFISSSYLALFYFCFLSFASCLAFYFSFLSSFFSIVFSDFKLLCFYLSSNNSSDFDSVLVFSCLLLLFVDWFFKVEFSLLFYFLSFKLIFSIFSFVFGFSTYFSCFSMISSIISTFLVGFFTITLAAKVSDLPISSEK